jgi:hypothetical protein
MPDLTMMQGLATAAAQLCAAHDELAAAGYESWSREIRALIDIIDAEVDWLRSDGVAIRFASSQ